MPKIHTYKKIIRNISLTQSVTEISQVFNYDTNPLDGVDVLSKLGLNLRLLLFGQVNACLLIVQGRKVQV